MATTSHYIYQPEVIGVKYNGNEVKRVYIDGNLQFDTDRLVIKSKCNRKGRLELPYKIVTAGDGKEYLDSGHIVDVQIKEAKTGSNVKNFYYKSNKLGPRRFHFNTSFEVGKYYIINAKITFSKNDTFALQLTSQISDPIVAVYSWGSTPIYSLAGLFASPTYELALQRPAIEYLPDHLPVGCKVLSNLFDYFRVGSGLPDNISKWDTSKIWNMYKTFHYVRVKIPTLKNWNVSNVTKFDYMFKGSSLNENIGNWKPSKNVTGVYEMMASTSDNKSGIDLSNWCFPKITNYNEIKLFAEGSTWAQTRSCRRSGFRRKCYYYYDRSEKLPKFNNSSC